MSFADIVSSMQQIQSQLAQLQNPSPPAATSAANATSFAAALDGATAPDAASAASAQGPGAANGTGTGQEAVQEALKYVGTPYVLGGNSKAGIDCSGLVQRAFAAAGVTMPRRVSEQMRVGEPVASLKDAKPGDLIVTDGNNHISIYLGNNTVVHAPYEGRTVSVQKVWFDDKDITTIRRVVPSEAPAPSGVSRSSPASALEAGLAANPTSSLSSLLSTLGTSGSTGSGTAQQLLAARAALMEGAA